MWTEMHSVKENTFCPLSMVLNISHYDKIHRINDKDYIHCSESTMLMQSEQPASIIVPKIVIISLQIYDYRL